MGSRSPKRAENQAGIDAAKQLKLNKDYEFKQKTNMMYNSEVAWEQSVYRNATGLSRARADLQQQQRYISGQQKAGYESVARQAAGTEALDYSNKYGLSSGVSHSRTARSGRTSARMAVLQRYGMIDSATNNAPSRMAQAFQGVKRQYQQKVAEDRTEMLKAWLGTNYGAPVLQPKPYYKNQRARGITTALKIGGAILGVAGTVATGGAATPLLVGAAGANLGAEGIDQYYNS